MNKRTCLALTATLAVVLAAVLLPPRLAALSDRALLERVYSEDIGNAEVSYVSKLTADQRMNLISLLLNDSGGVTVMNGATPAENELQLEQMADLLDGLWDRLREEGFLDSALTQAMDLSLSFARVTDVERPSLYLSLWSVHALLADHPKQADRACLVQLILDAETGVFYLCSLRDSSDNFNELDCKGLAQLIGDHAGLTLMECEEQTLADIESVGTSPIRLFHLRYENTDQESLSFSMYQNENEVGITCFSPSMPN